MQFSDFKKEIELRETFVVSGSFLFEEITSEQFKKIVNTFLPFVKNELNIKELPKIHFVENPNLAKEIGAFGRIKDNRIVIDIKNRHPMDILRTLAHELTHYRQHKQGKHGKSYAGSPTENEANQLAGKILRRFGEVHSNIFKLQSVK